MAEKKMMMNSHLLITSRRTDKGRDKKKTNVKNFCTCKSFCRIFHANHIWKKGEGDHILNKMKDFIVKTVKMSS